MADQKDEKPKPKVKRKVRADKYEGKVKFEGTLEQMIKMAVETKITEKEKDQK